jgi:hypothetical protein
MTLYSEKIAVTCESDAEDGPSKPVSFTWRKKEYRIEEILAGRQDWGFPAGAPRRKVWNLRRHRNYYKVRTACGRTFEIYMDRKTPQLTWILYQEIDSQEDT